MENTELVWGIPCNEIQKTHLFEAYNNDQRVRMRRYCHKTKGFNINDIKDGEGYYTLFKTAPNPDLRQDYFDNMICKSCLKSREGKRLVKLILYESI